MADFSDELLAGGLGFAVARLQALAALGSPDALADAFGVPRAAATGAAVAAHLSDARTEIESARQSLLVPDVGAAATHLSTALNGADAALAAVAWPGANPGLSGLVNLIRSQVVASGGLVRQIGLDAVPASAAGIAVEDGALVYRLTRATPTTLS